MMRQAIIDESLTWLKTPWHHRACVKGAGVDCVFFLVGVFNKVGLTNIVDQDIPYYPKDIMLHRSEETVLECITKYARARVDIPKRGDVAVWKFGRIYSHAAIVIDWPTVIHAYVVDGMVSISDATNGPLADRHAVFFSMVGD